MVKVGLSTKTNTVQPIIKQNVELGSNMHTDEWFAYRDLGRIGYQHFHVL